MGCGAHIWVVDRTLFDNMLHSQLRASTAVEGPCASASSHLVSQQAVVDKHAVQALPQHPVHQCGRNSAVNST